MELWEAILRIVAVYLLMGIVIALITMWPRGKQQLKKIGRNEPCPCGSERKYKKCCRIKKRVEFTRKLLLLIIGWPQVLFRR